MVNHLNQVKYTGQGMGRKATRLTFWRKAMEMLSISKELPAPPSKRAKKFGVVEAGLFEVLLRDEYTWSKPKS